jgi:hypothetical protein
VLDFKFDATRLDVAAAFANSKCFLIFPVYYLLKKINKSVSNQNQALKFFSNSKYLFFVLF